MHTFYAGQRITTSGGKFTGNGRVVKVLQKNVDIELDDGRKIRSHPSFLRPEGAAAPAAKVEDFAIVNVPCSGTIVRYTGTDGRITGLYVVIGEGFRRGHQTAKIARLGGDGGRFWNVPANDIELVDISEMLASL